MPTQTHPQSQLAGDLFDFAKDRIGVVEASRFMFSGHPAFGDRSPIQLLKAGMLIRLTHTKVPGH